ncbi:MAG: hypothetical protein AB7G06_00355 [Bdellovibrionales bacterium]
MPIHTYNQLERNLNELAAARRASPWHSPQMWSDSVDDRWHEFRGLCANLTNKLKGKEWDLRPYNEHVSERCTAFRDAKYTLQVVLATDPHITADDPLVARASRMGIGFFIKPVSLALRTPKI